MPQPSCRWAKTASAWAWGRRAPNRAGPLRSQKRFWQGRQASNSSCGGGRRSPPSERNRRKRIVVAYPGRRLGLSEAARALLYHLRGQRLAEFETEVRSLLEKLAQLGQERADLERALQATPKEA